MAESSPTEQFLFPQCFQRLVQQTCKKQGLVWERVNDSEKFQSMSACTDCIILYNYSKVGRLSKIYVEFYHHFYSKSTLNLIYEF